MQTTEHNASKPREPTVLCEAGDPSAPISPTRFATERLGIECWSKIREIMEAVASGRRKILVRSCNGAGKTTAIAALCNWKLSEFEDSIVLTTASSWTQVRRTLWGEIRRQARRGKLYDGTKLAQTSIPISDKHYALGISPTVPENAQGFHAPTILIAVDEATGVNREIIDALSGNLTNDGAQMIMICNPINTQSYPYEAERSGEWHLITISAFDHPNVVSGSASIRGAVTREWIEDRLRAWSHKIEPPDDAEQAISSAAAGGAITTARALYVPWKDEWYAKTPIVASRILGEWADTEAEGLIAKDLVERAMNLGTTKRNGQSDLFARRALGVDVGRGRDETVFALFEGDTQLPCEIYHYGDLMLTAHKVREKYEQGFTTIAIDDTGVGGGVTDRLREMGVPVIAVNFNQKAVGFLRHKKDLANARAEMYFLLEEELKDGAIRLTHDDLLAQEIAAVRLATTGNSTAFKLEDKDLTRRRLGRSPDRADATALARYALRLDAHKRRSFLL